MSTIVFLRHGQASLFSDDYDQLSDLGQQQSPANSVAISVVKKSSFDELYVGPRKRHRDTAALADELCGNLSAAEEMPEFDEHHVDQLVSNPPG